MANMRSFPVDLDKLGKLNVSVEPKARMVYDRKADGTSTPTGAQETDKDTGVPLWTIEVSTVWDGQVCQLRIKFASAVEPKFPLLSEVRAVDLIARPYDGGTSFSASSVSAVTAVKQG